MSTTGCENKMDSPISNIHNELRFYENQLKNDDKIFTEKLNLTRRHFSDYINSLIEKLDDIKIEYETEFNYLENEHKKTCDDNQQQFNHLCILKNQHENDQEKLSKIFNEFKEIFPLRPNMFKNIPDLYLQDIPFDSFIKKNNQSNHIQNSFSTITRIDRSTSPIIFNGSPAEKSNSTPTEHESSFIEIINDDTPSTSSKPTGSIGHSHHNQFAFENNATTIIESQSRSVSAVSTKNGSNRRFNISFQHPYESNRQSRLMAYDIYKHNILIYSLISHKLDCVTIETGQIDPIENFFKEPLLSLGYSSFHRCFYLITKQTHLFILFHLNNQQIQIEHQFQLTHENRKINYLITGHIYQNNLFFLYNLSPGTNIFGKYNFDQSKFISPIKFENIVGDNSPSTYEIIDFTVDNTYVTLLTRLTNPHGYMLIINDHDINQINSFELLDAKQPLSIISTNQPQRFNDDDQFLLYINDPRSHHTHCCNHERYLISIDINAWGICLSHDENLILVGNNLIRGLNIQDYIQRCQT